MDHATPPNWKTLLHKSQERKHQKKNIKTTINYQLFNHSKHIKNKTLNTRQKHIFFLVKRHRQRQRRQCFFKSPQQTRRGTVLLYCFVVIIPAAQKFRSLRSGWPPARDPIAAPALASPHPTRHMTLVPAPPTRGSIPSTLALVV